MSFFIKNHEDTYGIEYTVRWDRIIICGVAALVAIGVLLSSFTVVGAGHTGVVSTFGQVSENVLQEGFHFKAPWQKVKERVLTMKNVFAIILVMLCLAGILAGCGNKSFIDTTYTFDYVYVELPNGTVVEGKVQSWKDFDDGDQIQVTIDGKTYLTNSTRVVLVAK